MHVGYKSVTVVLALSAALALSSPAAAQSFNFGFHFGDEARDFKPRMAICFSDHQIREAIARRGYTQISLNVPNEGRIQVRATRGNWVYLIDYDYCRDWVRGTQRLRPAK